MENSFFVFLFLKKCLIELIKKFFRINKIKNIFESWFF